MIQRKTFLKRTPLRRVSKKRSRELAIYTKKRRIFLETNRACQVELDTIGMKQTDVFAVQHGKAFVGNEPPTRIIAASTEVHHRAGRTGTNFLDESTWIAVGRDGHNKIHQNPSWARAQGYLV